MSVIQVGLVDTTGDLESDLVEATAAALDLQNGQLDASWDCLKRVGNLSSASVLVVLEDVMRNRRPAPGTLGVLAAMGPGFCSELVLLKW